MEDRELVNKIVSSGKTECFAIIVKRYSGAVFSKALGIVRREELATEVTQQTFIKAYNNLSCWCGQSLAPWLMAISAHTALSALEKEKRQRAKPIENVAETEISGQESYSEERERMLSRMEKAMDSLPEGDRKLIELHYYKKMQTKDISKETGLSQANVLVKLHRIRERLKRQIEDERDE